MGWHLDYGGFPSLDMDHAIFNKEPPTANLKDGQQAMSVTHFQKGAEPYLGYKNSYGVIFPIAPPSTFWKYFQKSTRNGELCGECSDGQKCTPSGRAPLGDMTWEEFQGKKNAIVALTGTPSCRPQPARWAYNEFD